MNQKILFNLLTISIESDMFKNIEFKNLLTECAQEKTRKIEFM